MFFYNNCKFYYLSDMGVFTVDSVLKYYDKRVVLNDIAFQVKDSDIFAIFGRNGSGKTTLINVILGIEDCDYVFRKYDNKKIVNYNVCNYFTYSSQNKFIPDYLRIKQLLKLFNIKGKSLIEKDELISESLHLKFKELSYGQKFYVQLFLVIHSDKKICVLDEPFSGLSPKYTDVMIKYIKEYKNKIFIITDHNIEKLFEVSTKRAFLKYGKLINLDNSSLEEIKEMYYYTMI